MMRTTTVNVAVWAFLLVYFASLHTVSTQENRTMSDPGSGTEPPALEGPPASDGPSASPIPLPKPGTLRLSGGTNSSGRLEIFFRGEWGTICDDNFFLDDADIACRILGFPLARAFHTTAKFGEGTGKIWLDGFDCAGTRSHINCTTQFIGRHSCDHSEDVGITCGEVSHGVRLYGGPNNHTGVFELLFDDVGEALCGDTWSSRAATIACRELGFEQPLASGCKTRLPSEVLHSRFRDASCNGEERELLDCFANHPQTDTCKGDMVAAGVCGFEDVDHGNPIQDVRLFGGSRNRGGRVEVLVGGLWLGLTNRGWNKQHADIVCHQLGFGDSLSLRNSVLRSPTAEYSWVKSLSCHGGERTLAECLTITSSESSRSDYCEVVPATVICGRNTTGEDQETTVPRSCTATTSRVMLGSNAANSATDMIFIVDVRGLDLSLVDLLDWYLPLLDLDLTGGGFGTNSSCKNRFSLVRYVDNAGYQVYSKADSTGYFQPVENVERVFNDFGGRKWLIPESSSATLDGVSAALDDIMVEMRPSTHTCLVARNVVVMTSVRFPYPGDELSVTLEKQLRKYDATLHTFMRGNSFSFKGGFVGIGRTTSTGYADFQLNTCFYSASLSYTPAEAGDPMSNISKVALKTGGSVWQLHPGSNYTATSCAFQDVIINQLNKRIATCFYCHCSSSGQESCVVAGSQEEECRCEETGRKFQEGLCIQPTTINGEEVTPNFNSNPATLIPMSGQATSSSSMLTAIIASLSGILALALILVALMLIRRKRKRQQKQDYESQQDGDLREKERPLPSVTAAVHHVMTMLAAPASSSLKIIPNELLTFAQCIGKGQFGEVHLGLLHHRRYSEASPSDGTKVAIKIVPDANISQENSNALLEEYFLQQAIGEHPNIVKFLLGGLFKGQACIVMEYMDGGDLHSFLRNIKGSQRLSHSHTMNLQEVEKLDIASQIARGLEFLASKKIVHRDIAARNILLQEHRQLHHKLIAKISDWGLSRRTVVEGSYQAQTNRKLPVKWMAIESIVDGTFTEKSDVWSFGVLLWELASMGEVPYSGTPNALLLEILQKGTRLERPIQCSNAMFSMMSRYWKEDPNERPKFEFIAKDLTSELENETNYITVLGEIEDIPDDVNTDAVKTTDSATGCQRRPSVIPQVLEMIKQDTLDHLGDGSNGNVTRVSLETASERPGFRESCDSANEPLNTASRYISNPAQSQVTLSSSPVHSVPAPSIQE